ncbi:hypothetical protein ACOMHN_001547 [Nucella lapillus]
MSKTTKTSVSVRGSRPEVTHLLTLEQLLCRERPYVRDIPPPRPSARFLLTSPVRKRSFYNVNQAVSWPPNVNQAVSWPPNVNQAVSWPPKEPRRPKLLRRIIYEERLRDIMHRVTRPTYSFRTKYPALVRPEQMYTCCPQKGF